MTNPSELLRQQNVEIDPSDHRPPAEILQALQDLGVLALGTKPDERPYFVR